MASRYGRKKRRAHRALVADMERRANEMARNFQRLIADREAKVREAQAAMKHLAAPEVQHRLREIARKAADTFTERALLEIGKSGINLMHVYADVRPDYREMREVRVYTVVIPETVWRTVVEIPR